MRGIIRGGGGGGICVWRGRGLGGGGAGGGCGGGEEVSARSIAIVPSRPMRWVVMERMTDVGSFGSFGVDTR